MSICLNTYGFWETHLYIGYLSSLMASSQNQIKWFSVSNRQSRLVPSELFGSWKQLIINVLVLLTTMTGEKTETLTLML